MIFNKNSTVLFLSFILIQSSVFAAGRFSSPSSNSKKPFFDFDISGSSGNYNGSTYSEVNLGLNLNFTDWLTWRNAAFKRFSSGTNPESTGLDSSLRFVLDTPFDGGGFRVFAGPGYRWSSPSTKNALLGEAGASIQLGRFSLGAGAKYLRYDQAQYDSNGIEIKKDDVSYFVTIAGGAGLSF